MEGSLPRTGATPVSRTLQRSWNQHCDGPNRRRRARSQSPACMCMSAPPPRLPIDHPHSAGSVAGGGCRPICRFGGSIGSNARGPTGSAGAVGPAPWPERPAYPASKPVCSGGKQAYARPQAHNEMQPTPPDARDGPSRSPSKRPRAARRGRHSRAAPEFHRYWVRRGAACQGFCEMRWTPDLTAW